MSRQHTCFACGKRITWQFAICASCEKTYGKSPSEWPQWLAFLWRDEQRIRRQDKRVITNELSFSDISESIGDEDISDGSGDCIDD